MRTVTFNDIIGKDGVFIDGDWVESKDQDPNGDVRLLQLADIGDGHFINKSNRFLTIDSAKKLKCTFLEPGDILVARMPDPIGRACIFPELDMPCVTVVDVCIIRPDRKIVSNIWLKFLINSFDFRKSISQFVTGTTRQRISRGNLAKLSFTLPSFQDQIRIAEVLTQAENLIKQRKESIDLLDDFLRSTFLEMFGDPFINLKKHKVVALEEIAAKEKYSIVDGPFGSSLKEGDYFETGIPIIRINNIRDEGFYNDQFKYINEKKYEELKRSKIQYNDILIARVGNTIGKSCLFNQNFKALLSTTGVAKLTVNNELVNVKYIIAHLRLPQYRKYIWNQTEGGGQPYLNLKKIKNFKILLPPIELQNQFATIVEKAESLKKEYEASLHELENMYGVLSQKAFKGELNIKK
ncbi:restriction endonuclease subunit S [Flavobacterium gyeonganense]|uniref:Restriction endonuclease subunit S n=1 Tax=Flavobacterium gyeonganense TaxID=1310418 RepID=A0ABV5H739_9FLAO|nr:restriction endonuclease subunit S [Flavobacterium gyeonganense]